MGSVGFHLFVYNLNLEFCGEYSQPDSRGGEARDFVRRYEKLYLRLNPDSPD